MQDLELILRAGAASSLWLGIHSRGLNCLVEIQPDKSVAGEGLRQLHNFAQVLKQQETPRCEKSYLNQIHN